MKKGVLLSLATATISGVSIFTNAIFVSKTDPLIFAVIRNFVVAGILTMILVGVGQIHKLKLLTKREWGKLAVIGAIGGGIPFVMFFTGLSQIGAVNGNIIHKTLFLWVALLALPILKERMSRVQLAGYLTLFLGMFVVGGTFTVIPKTGTWLILAATILWAIENVIAKVTLRSVPSTIVSWGRMVFGLPFLFIAALIMGKVGLFTNSASWAPAPIIASSILLTLYVTTWYSALAKAPATLVSSVLVFAPVVTALLTGIILKKPVIQQQAMNLTLLTVGTFLIVVERLIHKKPFDSLGSTRDKSAQGKSAV